MKKHACLFSNRVDLYYGSTDLVVHLNLLVHKLWTKPYGPYVMVNLINPYRKDNIEAEQNNNFYGFSLLDQLPSRHDELQTFHL